MTPDPRARTIGALVLAALFVIGGGAGLLRAARGDVGPKHLAISVLGLLIGLVVATAALRPRGPRSP